MVIVCMDITIGDSGSPRKKTRVKAYQIKAFMGIYDVYSEHGVVWRNMCVFKQCEVS